MEIEIKIGSKKGYRSTDPQCVKQITYLTKRAGLQDYVCTENPPPGKFVNIVKPNGGNGALVLCEIKVFKG